MQYHQALNQICDLIDNPCRVVYTNKRGYFPIYSKVVYYYFKQSEILRNKTCDVLRIKMDICATFSGFSKVSSHSNDYLRAIKMMRIQEQCIKYSFVLIFNHRFLNTCINKICEFAQGVNNSKKITTPIDREKLINAFSILFAKILIFMDNFAYPYSYSEDTHSFHSLYKGKKEIFIHPIFWNMVLQSKSNIIVNRYDIICVQRD